MNMQKHNDKLELANWLANHVAQKLKAAIEKTGKASLAVSGGSTPVRFFAALSKQSLNWNSVYITLVDERWVPDNHERSNAKMVKELLLVDNASKANFLPLFQEGKNTSQIQEIEKEYASLLPFDVVILGMGGDGHTASFFPNGTKLSQATDPNTENLLIDIEAEGAGEPRVTFTLPALCSAAELILHIEGDEKKAVLEEAQKAGDANLLPIRHILRSNADLSIVWAP